MVRFDIEALKKDPVRLGGTGPSSRENAQENVRDYSRMYAG